MILPQADVESLIGATIEAASEFLAPGKPRTNVVGIGAGVKWRNCQPTGEPAILVLVTRKIARKDLAAKHIVPAKLQNVQTDVLAVGHVLAGGSTSGGAKLVPAKRSRPAAGGQSIGHYQGATRTIATCVYDLLPGASTDPNNPVHGEGIPGKWYILGNNHILARTNVGPIGAPILQPGRADGGMYPADQVATLSRFVPIELTPEAPVESQDNLVDCAVAEGQFCDLDRAVYGCGYVRGWRPRAQVLRMVGHAVKKVGRGSNLTTGRITAIAATIDITYPGGKVARMKDQIATTSMCGQTDSGSLLMTLDNIAIGLSFATCSNGWMIANQIENVRALLRVEVAEQVL
jgi:hypothetical protein